LPTVFAHASSWPPRAHSARYSCISFPFPASLAPFSWPFQRKTAPAPFLGHRLSPRPPSFLPRSPSFVSFLDPPPQGMILFMQTPGLPHPMVSRESAFPCFPRGRTSGKPVPDSTSPPFLPKSRKYKSPPSQRKPFFHDFIPFLHNEFWATFCSGSGVKNLWALLTLRHRRVRWPISQPILFGSIFSTKDRASLMDSVNS